MKRILCLVFAVLMTLTFVACDSGKDSSNNSNPTGTKVDSSIKKGDVSAVGDVFTLPDVKQAAGAPVIAEVTKQAYPGDSIMVAGEGFKGAGVKFYIYSQSTKDNGKAHEAKFTVSDDNYASVLIDEGLDYGMYGVYAENASGTSAIKTVNKPQIWEIGMYRLSAKEKLTILGENLTTDNGDKTSAFLVSEDGKEYCEASVSFADPGKVEIIIPEGLKAGNKYRVKIHNGHGGSEGFAESEKLVEYLEKPAVQFNGKVIDVTKLGADPKSRTNDDSPAILKAVAQANEGDIIYFPPGSYLMASTVIINKSVKILGAGADKTTIFAGYNVTSAIFEVKKGPCEITGIRFEQKRNKGKLKGTFLNLQADSIEDGEWNFYVHSNTFIQSVTPKSRSANWPVEAYGAYGVVIEDNYFDATGMVQVGNAKKVFVRNNEGIMNVYVGNYYQVVNNLFTNIEFLDVSNNKITGAGAPSEEEGPGALNIDEFTAGRVLCVQGWAKNTYISHNNVRRCGITGANAGEIILYENLTYLFDGMVDSATKDTVILKESDKNKIVVGSIISINGGKGRGQYRRVTKRAKLTVTVDEPWDIIPDSTSHVVVNNAYSNAFVCYNNLDGHTNWAENWSSTMGLQAYGAIHNMFYCQNTIKNACNGICVTPYYYDNAVTGQEADAKCIIAWNQFDRNNFENVGQAINMSTTASGSDASAAIPGEISYANTFRKNNIKNISDYTDADKKGSGGMGIRMGPNVSKWAGAWCIANLYEGNTFEKCSQTDIFFGENQKNNIFRNNKNGENKASSSIVSGNLGPIEVAY